MKIGLKLNKQNFQNTLQKTFICQFNLCCVSRRNKTFAETLPYYNQENCILVTDFISIKIFLVIFSRYSKRFQLIITTKANVQKYSLM